MREREIKRGIYVFYKHWTSNNHLWEFQYTWLHSIIFMSQLRPGFGECSWDLSAVIKFPVSFHIHFSHLSRRNSLSSLCKNHRSVPPTPGPISNLSYLTEFDMSLILIFSCQSPWSPASPPHRWAFVIRKESTDINTEICKAPSTTVGEEIRDNVINNM